MGQCAGELALRNRHLRERPGLHLVRKCPRVPPHSLVQRSRERFERRSVLYPRRRERPLLVAHAAAQTRRRHLIPSGTDSATASSSTPRAASARNCGFTWPSTRRSSSRCSKLRNESGRSRRLSATGYVRMGAGRPAAEIGACTWSPKSTPNGGALFARNSYNTEFADRVAFFDVRRSKPDRNRRSH